MCITQFRETVVFQNSHQKLYNNYMQIDAVKNFHVRMRELAMYCHVIEREYKTIKQMPTMCGCVYLEPSTRLGRNEQWEARINTW